MGKRRVISKKIKTSVEYVNSLCLSRLKNGKVLLCVTGGFCSYKDGGSDLFDVSGLVEKWNVFVNRKVG
jgi:hypothetical protein